MEMHNHTNDINNTNFFLKFDLRSSFKGFVRYIFASLFFKFKGEHLRNKIFYFSLKALFVLEIIKF